MLCMLPPRCYPKLSYISKSGSPTRSFAGEPDGVPNWPNGVSLGAGYVVPRTGGHGAVQVSESSPYPRIWAGRPCRVVTHGRHIVQHSLIHDLTVRMPIFGGKTASARDRHSAEANGLRSARSAREQTMSGGLSSCVYVRYHIITRQSCAPARC